MKIITAQSVNLVENRYCITVARFGLGSAWLPPVLSNVLWIHALSVGEVFSALPLVKGLRQRFPKQQIAFSVATFQGLETARNAIANLSGITLFIRPIVPWAVERLLNRLQPSLFCLVEGDIWPNWQWSLARRGVPQLLVNSRISPRTFKNYQRFAPLAKKLFLGFNRVLTQTQADLDHLATIGIELTRLSVNGNLKFDSTPLYLTNNQRQIIAAKLGLQGRRIIVAGSIHPGEEKICLKVFQILRATYHDLVLILAPRNIRRGKIIVRLAIEKGFKAVCFSQFLISEKFDILVLDIMGHLSKIYALSTGSFIGGSLVEVGGHNLLEPAAQGIPVIFGPHIYNFNEIAQGLIKVKGGYCVTNSAELAYAWRELLINPVKTSKMGKAALNFCQIHRGALKRCLDEIEFLLKKTRDNVNYQKTIF